MPQSKENNMTTQWFQTKSYNVQNSHKNKQQKKMTMSHHKVLNKFTDKEAKKWAHLEIQHGF